MWCHWIEVTKFFKTWWRDEKWFHQTHIFTRGWAWRAWKLTQVECLWLVTLVACGNQWPWVNTCINLALILPEGIEHSFSWLFRKRKWFRLNLDASGRHVTCKLPIKQAWFRAQLVCCDLWAALPARDHVQNTALCLLWGKQASSNRLCVRVLFSSLSPRIEPKMHLRFCVRAVSLCACFVEPSVVWPCLAGVHGGVSPCEAWARALGGDRSVMSRIGKRRIIGTGWRVVNSADRWHHGVESSTVD